MEQVKRVASALVILPPLIFLLLYASPVYFLLLVLACIGLSLREYFHILRDVCSALCITTTWLAAFALALAAYYGGAASLQPVLFASLVALTLSVLVASAPLSHLWPMFMTSVCGLLFIGWTLSHLMVLRLLPEGPWYVFFLCAVVWVGDTAAMYVGKSLGRHKLAPRVSPGKTWEGAAGGVLGSMGSALVGAYLWLPHLMWWQCILLGCCIALAGQISDLGESVLKRYAGVKDSGRLIPGHGGILDRIDSMLFAAPTLVYALHVLLLMPSA